MPTKREREYFAMGYRDGFREGQKSEPIRGTVLPLSYEFEESEPLRRRNKPKRKLSAWNKYVKANSKKPRFRLRSGSPNLKKLAVAFRKTPAGRKRKK